MSLQVPHADGNVPAPKAENAMRLYYGNDEFNFGDLRLPNNSQPEPYPVAILIHGGFWQTRRSLDLMDALADDLTQRGFATWNIEYRRVKYEDKPGNSGGGWPGTFLDVANAADYVRDVLAKEFPLDLQKVVVIGHSAGGQLALWLAARPKLPKDSPLDNHTQPLQLAEVVSLAGVNDLKLMWEVRQNNSPVANFLDGTPTEQPERYQLGSPIEWLPLGVSQILVHGDADLNVPTELSRSYYAAAHAAGDSIEYLEFSDVDHFVIIDPQSEAWVKIVNALYNRPFISS